MARAAENVNDYSGHYLCGGVHIFVNRKAATAAICHCEHCQRQTGSAFSSILIASVDHVVATGELKSFSDMSEAGRPVKRLFCPVCGSPVLTRSAELTAAGLCAVKAGTLYEGAPSPVMEVFSARRRPWMPDLHSQQRFDGMPSS